MNLEKYLKSKKQVIDKALGTYLKKIKQTGKVGQAMHYSAMAGGKRFRPILMLAVAEAFGKDKKIVIPSACAIELVHAFSLIHDDLPSMDNDDFRRGKLTCHKKFGEASAILAGDALSGLAFELICRFTPKSVSAEKTRSVCLELAYAMGVNGLVGGQDMDLSYSGNKLTLKILEEIHFKKTAALIVASIRAAAILCGASLKQQRSLTSYAKHLGLGFQIADDILDETASFGKLGRSPGSDKRNKKTTYVGLLGQEDARKKAARQIDQAILAIKDFGCQADRLRQIAGYALERAN